MIELGDTVKDNITGFQGIVVCISEWMNNCRRITLQPQKLDKDGQPIKTSTFDEPDCTVIRKAQSRRPKLAKTGGPRPEPTRRG